VIDVGAGDGGYALYRAKTQPSTFVIALDASPDALSDGAWRAKRSRAVNAAFLVEAVERIPIELSGLADEVTVHFPWGSLLRGLVAADPAVLCPIASLLRPGGELRILLSATERDGYAQLTPDILAALASPYFDCGLRPVTIRWASPPDIAASRSGWAKRLRVGGTREAVLARYRRADPVDG
jgi:16S rRNA (adenine(1408)-N(1))-methyltransferase